MKTKTWQDDFEQEYWGKFGSTKTINDIKQFISDLRKKDEEELIKMLPDYRMVFPEQDTEDIIKYKLGFNDGIQKIKQLIKDYYEK
jgi:hypothetical protein